MLHLLSLDALFVSRSSNDAPELGIIGEHGNIEIQLAYATVDVDNGQNGAVNGVLGDITLNCNLCRLLVADMDNSRAAD
ncbi:unnamed protein product [Dibothriocephalus latus]|uniref:Uncharacterized protein n=1 Tax=Dibothriocephalus latus TaxID=60516 RepID=A0A3P6Q5Z7_DIBLA|nr:unnamed protein product [Dibothriocephalus latus]